MGKMDSSKFRGPSPSNAQANSCQIEDKLLKKIKVTIARPVSNPDPNKQIERNLDNPGKLIIHRGKSEGKKKIFDRKDIVVNKEIKEIEQIPEESSQSETNDNTAQRRKSPKKADARSDYYSRSSISRDSPRRDRDSPRRDRDSPRRERDRSSSRRDRSSPRRDSPRRDCDSSRRSRTPRHHRRDDSPRRSSSPYRSSRRSRSSRSSPRRRRDSRSPHRRSRSTSRDRRSSRRYSRTRSRSTERSRRSRHRSSTRSPRRFEDRRRRYDHRHYERRSSRERRNSNRSRRRSRSMSPRHMHYRSPRDHLEPHMLGTLPLVVPPDIHFYGPEEIWHYGLRPPLVLPRGILPPRGLYRPPLYRPPFTRPPFLGVAPRPAPVVNTVTRPPTSTTPKTTSK